MMFEYRRGRFAAANSLSQRELGAQFWSPAADVYQTQSGWVVKVELAGVRRQDVHVTVEGNLLRIAGERRDWTVTQAQRCESLEISYHRFERTIPFNVNLDASRIVAEFQDGMLLVKILTHEASR